MNALLKGVAAITLGLTTAIAFAAPSHLTTDNQTNYQSNAFINGTVQSPYPTPKKTKKSLLWSLVQLACAPYVDSQKQCGALIKMGTDTSNPVEVGWLKMNMSTGDITPKKLSANGFTITVINAGEVIITEDKN
ncbi:hypothetical protein GH742_10930 [Legionella sp. MW5194]|uniref:hypothetical protein n=1 Tax=Legionella sp. MW5194 TaxID=2662448 RepID=UPI00193DF4E8|nr:hypothetical protein [Legionella sp. MW5194]QRN04349.1 hypothetical protein GH742_10930 [Legionella sp. MW5194]